jgi:DNA helicase-2/ATP-dependent DNA helicase PcrA
VIEILLGPPGTGKTTRLLREVEIELERGVPPDRIGYVSFTTRAADEARDRACDRFGLSRSQFPFFSTIHSICFRQLGLSSGDVFEKRYVQEFADYAKVKITGRWTEDGTFSGYEVGDRIMFMENLARVRGVPLRELYNKDDDGIRWSQVDKVSRELVHFKQTKGLLDYTDMLEQFSKSGIEVPLEVLLVDESQDLSWRQWQVVEKLRARARRTVVAGDDDQAIYRWAGADVEHLINLEGEVEVLGQSWRVPRAVQAAAQRIVSRISRRREKEWAPREAEGEVEHTSTFKEVDVGEGTALVLARNTYILSEVVEPELRRQGVIYEREGRPSVSRARLDAIRAWEQLRAGEAIMVSQARHVYEQMSSGTGVARGHKTLPGFDDPDAYVGMGDLKKRGGLLTDAVWYEAMDRMPDKEYIRAARHRGEKLQAQPRVRLSTIHGAKGAEADHVVLLKEMARRTHHEMKFWPDDEARVWYVGVTRAKDRLTVVESPTARYYPHV